MIKIVEAVSAVFCFQGQIFSVIRQNHLDVFPGYNAFPGGKIDDQDLPSRIASSFPKLNSVHLSALCREMKEELSFDLEKAFAEDKIISIEPLAEIFAPSFAQIRFRNWFYRIDLKDPAEFILDEGEFSAGSWINPPTLLKIFHQGKALMVPPLRTMLKQLIQDPNLKQMGDLSIHFDDSREIPELEMLEGVRMLMVPSHTLPPAERTNAFRLGDPDSPQILVDSSPKSDETYLLMLEHMKQDSWERWICSTANVCCSRSG